MSPLATTKHRTDFDVVTVVPVKLLHLATATMVGVGQGVPNNTKVVLQKALEGSMRESEGRHRRHRRKGQAGAG
jgi:hypothetical protein